MPGTQVRQTREPVSTDTGTQYQITAQTLVPGTLPDLSIFLFEVIQDEDPKSDVFARVVTPADFGDYSTDRDASITANTRFYRATQLVSLYDNIADAQGAHLELTSRISKLVNDYDAYITSFVTESFGEVVVYPTADESEKAALIAQYEAAAAGIEALEDARDAENAECTLKMSEYESLQARLAEAQSDYTTLQAVVPALYAMPPVYISTAALATNAVNNIAVVVAASTASSTDKASVVSYTNTALLALGDITTMTNTLINDVSLPVFTLAGALNARVAQLTSDTLAKQQEVNDCHLELATMQAQLDAARAARDAALAAVRAVCPDYTPS